MKVPPQISAWVKTCGFLQEYSLHGPMPETGLNIILIFVSQLRKWNKKRGEQKRSLLQIQEKMNYSLLLENKQGYSRTRLKHILKDQWELHINYLLWSHPMSSCSGELTNQSALATPLDTWLKYLNIPPASELLWPLNFMSSISRWGLQHPPFRNMCFINSVPRLETINAAFPFWYRESVLFLPQEKGAEQTLMGWLSWFIIMFR